MPDQSPIAIVLQCHKCQKRLKYTGKKPVVTCPGCGESLTVQRVFAESENAEAELERALDGDFNASSFVPDTTIVGQEAAYPRLPNQNFDRKASSENSSFRLSTALLMLLTFVGGVVVSRIAVWRPSNSVQKADEPLAAAKPKIAQQNVFGLAVPSIKRATWKPSSVRSRFGMGKFGNGLDNGTQFTVTIENSGRFAISYIEFIVELRRKSRSVPQATTVVKQQISGGIESGLVEPTIWFIPSEAVGDVDTWDGLPADHDFYVAIATVRYYDDAQTEETHSPPLLVKAIEQK